MLRDAADVVGGHEPRQARYPGVGQGAELFIAQYPTPAGARGALDAFRKYEVTGTGIASVPGLGETSFRVQDRVAAEVAQAVAQVQSARERLGDAEVGFREALDSFAKNLEGLSQTRRAGEFLILVVRPQEVVAAVQALGQANADYYGAVADYNRAQFRLYRALGQPAQCLAGLVPEPPAPTP